MFRPTIALSLVVSFALAGCGSHVAQTPTLPTKASAALASNSKASVQLQTGAAAIATLTKKNLSNIVVTGAGEMTDDELADDARSLGFSILDAAVSKTGFVRRTVSGWALESTTGIFTKTTTNYTLTGTSNLLAQLSIRENKKSTVSGTLNDAGTTIDVSTVKSNLDLGVLTNWLTKGKFDGVVKGETSRLPIPDATVTVTNTTTHFIFTGLSDKHGEFSIKCLEPGSYTIAVSKAGYASRSLDTAQALKARKKVHLGIDLASI